MSNSQKEVGMPTFGGLSQKQNGLLLPESKSSWPSEMSSAEPKSLIGNMQDQQTSVTRLGNLPAQMPSSAKTFSEVKNMLMRKLNETNNFFIARAPLSATSSLFA